jgi:hypothetical protein
MGKKKIDNEQHGKVVNYTLDGVSIHPVTTKIHVSFLTQLPDRKDIAQGFHHKANGDFKIVTELSLCHNTNLIDSVKERSLYRRKIFQNMHCVYNKALK